MMKAIRGKKLTSREAARVLGVSEASVKRWADSGLLPMEKTAGGHRRFRPEDVAVIRRAGPREKESRLLGKRSAARLPARPAQESELAPGREAALLEETFRALLDGRDEELSALLVNLHLHGQSVGAIADSFLCAAMRRVGDLWHAGELSVAQEHVATRTATNALQKLQAVLDAPVEEGTRALCCSVEDDFHDLPLRLAALTLEAVGVEVFNLGMNTPFFALTEAMERFRPDVVCVSSTILVSPDRAAREYAEFHKTARRVRATVVLGGAGFAAAGIRNRLPADLHAESFRQLEEFIRTQVANETWSEQGG
jgi:excisionase family DNA binding protein